MSNVAPVAPRMKVAMAFFDGQNLYRHAKDAFGHHHPNYDPIKLHNAVCSANGWRPNMVRFYTGVPDVKRDPTWGGYWNNRVIALKRARVHVTTRQIRYHDEEVTVGDIRQTVTSSREKGIDIRIALDLVACARRSEFDVAVIFSQDQDLHEVVAEVRDIARTQGREIEICCAFPISANASSKRGIDKTGWFKMDQAFYDACLDPTDYRSKI